MSKLKRKIKNGLKKDAEALRESLSGQAADSELVQASVGIVSKLLIEEKNLTDKRKKLSRQIGAARKQKQDPAELIAGVSAISAKLKVIDVNIDEEVARIAEDLETAGATESGSTSTSSPLPAHLSVAEKALACDLTELQLAHSDSIDVAEWQGFVASKAHANVCLLYTSPSPRDRG